MRKDSFVKGAVILGLGLGFTKLLGFYRLVLPRLMGAEGVGLFNMAYPIYNTLLVLSTAGIPVAISKLVAERVARGDGPGAQRVFRVSLALLFSLGLFFSTLMLAGAGFITRHITLDPRSYYPLVAIAPAILPVSVMSALRGFFQGLQRMAPPSTSYLVEQVVRVGTIITLAAALLPLGVQYAAAGATLGALTGALASLGYLTFVYLRARVDLPRAAETQEPLKAFWAVARQVLYMAVPISLAGLVFPVMQNIDLLVVPARLRLIGVGVERATELYGLLTGMAMTIVYLPTVFTTALSFSLVPSISEAQAVGDSVAIPDRTMTALRATMVLTLPAAAGALILATPICRLLFAHPEAGGPLQVMSPGLLLLALQQTTSGVLQGVGRIDIPVKNLAMGAGVKFLATWVLTPLPQLGINGAAVGTILGFLVAAGLNLQAVNRLVGISPDWAGLILRPGAATAVMALGVWGAYRWLMSRGLGNSASTLAAVLAGMVVYSVAILLLGGVRRQDLEALPRVGPRLARLLGRLRLVRG
ncbi:MAG: polysaccharide biosynthesis protein [Acetobacteraceae bacterium]|nr:polysaccharide biosynthesis protein [Acetobacteraceae bacterium]